MPPTISPTYPIAGSTIKQSTCVYFKNWAFGKAVNEADRRTSLSADEGHYGQFTYYFTTGTEALEHWTRLGLLLRFPTNVHRKHY
ncbi:hypothetical protein [Spirosoma pollinicola]|nr:hypothetical protein [Spirosoma pollinicola]